jgi:Flp pilus assembly protein TadG
MQFVNNEKGSVLVFVTLMIILLVVMVGMGLDTGHMTYTRSQGQAAVDSAALSAVSGLPSGSATEVVNRATAFNSNNDYVSSPSNTLGAGNVTYVSYNDTTGAINYLPSVTGANGVRVSLEKDNPYSGTAQNNGIQTPGFLTPLMRLFGASAQSNNNVSVSAVAALKAVPGIPIAVMSKLCTAGTVNPDQKLRQAKATEDNSCWTTYTDNPPSEKRVRELFTNSATCTDLPASSDLVTIGTPIELQNGQDTKTYAAAEDLFLTKYPGRCWYVPVLPNSTKCNQSDPIKDWAKICPTKLVDQGGDKYILASVQCQQDLFSAKDNLCFSSRLLRDTKSGM